VCVFVFVFEVRRLFLKLPSNTLIFNSESKHVHFYDNFLIYDVFYVHLVSFQTSYIPKHSSLLFIEFTTDDGRHLHLHNASFYTHGCITEF